MNKSILIYQDDEAIPLITIDNLSDSPVFNDMYFDMMGAEILQVLNRSSNGSKFRLENSKWE